MKPSTDRMNGVQARKPCGCYSTDDTCECSTANWPDPWLVAGEDVNLERLSETRAYRQTKFRRS